MQRKLLRLPQVLDAVGLSRSEIYRLVSLGRFPAPVPLGERAVAWSDVEIEQWITARVAAREQRKNRPEERAAE